MAAKTPWYIWQAAVDVAPVNGRRNLFKLAARMPLDDR